MKKFSKEALVPENDKWELAIKRCDDLYSRKDDIRGPFLISFENISCVYFIFYVIKTRIVAVCNNCLTVLFEFL